MRRLHLLRPDAPQAVYAARPGPEVPSRRYPTNAMGIADFASVILTLDHLLDADDFHVHQKAVYSTETASEALTSLFKYYKEQRLFGVQNVLDTMLALTADPAHTIALYSVPTTTRDRVGGIIIQCIMSTQALNKLVAHPDWGHGSSLMAMENLVGYLSDALPATTQSEGGLPPVLILKIMETLQPEQPLGQQQTE